MIYFTYIACATLETKLINSFEFNTVKLVNLAAGCTVRFEYITHSNTVHKSVSLVASLSTWTNISILLLNQRRSDSQAPPSG